MSNNFDKLTSFLRDLKLKNKFSNNEKLAKEISGLLKSFWKNIDIIIHRDPENETKVIDYPPDDGLEVESIELKELLKNNESSFIVEGADQKLKEYIHEYQLYLSNFVNTLRIQTVPNKRLQNFKNRLDDIS